MYFALATSLLALCSPVISVTVPRLQTTNVTHAVSVVNTLQSNILPHTGNINSTIAALGANPTTAQRNAALQSVTSDIQGMTSALYVAIDALDLEKVLSLRDSSLSKAPRGDPVSNLGELLYLTAGIFVSSIGQIIKAFGTGDIQQIVTQLDAPFDYLFFVLLSFITDSGPFSGDVDTATLISRINEFNALLVPS